LIRVEIFTEYSNYLGCQIMATSASSAIDISPFLFFAEDPLRYEEA
jgi:hypothetical protein